MDCGNRAGIDGSEKGTQWQETIRLIAAMGQAVFEPSTITFTSAISACEKGAEWRRFVSSLQWARLSLNPIPSATTRPSALAKRVLSGGRRFIWRACAAGPLEASTADCWLCGSQSRSACSLRSAGEARLLPSVLPYWSWAYFFSSAVQIAATVQVAVLELACQQTFDEGAVVGIHASLLSPIQIGNMVCGNLRAWIPATVQAR